MTAAYDPDAVAAALVAVLTPGGVPVGTIGAITRRTPDAGYQGAVPLVIVRPVQTVRDWVANLSKRDMGHLEVLYRDPPLAQQQAETPGRTQAQIEDRLWANRQAIITQLDTHRTLDGAVQSLGPYQETYNPDGVVVSWDNGPWVGLSLIIAYTGLKQNMTPFP